LISHVQARERFSGVAEQDLPRDEAARVQAHLRECGECRIEYDRFTRTLTLVRETEREKAPPGLAARILKRLRRRRRTAREVAGEFVERRVPMEAGGALLVLLAAAALLFFLW
jgi:predicted anti-sigma-YlaC factor YlaD